MDFSDEIPGFLIESGENLAQLDLEMVELERNPEDDALVASVFRTIHTLKGTSGFFGFSVLGSVTHVAENILGQVREKLRPMTPEVVSLILETVDAVRLVLASIESTGAEGIDRYQPLRDRLERAYLAVSTTETPRTEGVALESLAPRQQLDVALIAEAVPEAVRPEEAVPEAAVSSPQAPPVEEPNPPRNRRAEDQGLSNATIRVDVSLLDKLMNLVGELVLARNQILQGAAPSLASNGTAQRLNLITSELQEGVMRTRMQPIGGVWNKLPRVVRDLAAELGKKIEIQMEGAETELDKTIIEAIKDPLTHIVRNSCDHGIELPESRILKGKNAVGTITLRAFHEGGHVNIEIADDGAGIDPERVKQKALQKGLIRPELAAQLNDWESLRLIFLPGFSTAEKVTGISGRGVGMDVVKTNIEKISGVVDLTNRAGGGTIIKIKIPLTLAIIPGLIVSLRRGEESSATSMQRFVIPQANLLELVRLEGDRSRTQIERIHGIEVYRRRGKLLPLAYLSDLLGLPANRTEDTTRNIVVVKAEETAFGLVVDEVNDTQEIVVKALGKQLKGLGCYLGATIMGDGRIALILDVNGIAILGNILANPLDRVRSGAVAEHRRAEEHQMLLFRAGRFARLVLDLSLVARLEEIARTRLEYAVGSPVVRYRETILPLVSLRSLLDPGSVGNEMQADSLQVIVFDQGGRYVGLVVDEILDILDDRVTVKQPCSTFGLLGSGVVGGRIADFIDLEAILAAAKTHPAAQGPVEEQPERSVLLVDRGKTERGLLRSFLEMQGMDVIDCATAKHAIERLERRHFDVVISALPFAEEGGVALATELRCRPELASLKLIGLTSNVLQKNSPDSSHNFDLLVSRADRPGLVQAIRTLVPASPAPSAVEYELAGRA